jgi:hypothetical protein
MRFSEWVGELRDDERAVGETVTELLTYGAALLVGTVVMSTMVTAVPSNAGMFNEARGVILETLNSSFVLASIVPLAIVAGAVLSYLRRFDRV